MKPFSNVAEEGRKPLKRQSEEEKDMTFDELLIWTNLLDTEVKLVDVNDEPLAYDYMKDNSFKVSELTARYRELTAHLDEEGMKQYKEAYR